MSYGSIVLDMDGVILDFEGDDFRWKYDAVREVLRSRGVDPSDFSRPQLDVFLGDEGVDACVESCEELGLDAGEVWEEIARKTTEARIEKVKTGEFTLYPEVKDVLEQLENMKLGLGVISNAPEKAVEAVITHYDLRRHLKYFRGVTGFDDLTARKPHPDHLKLAQAELKREPYAYAGDAESDLIAAREAGMDSVWVRRNDAKVDVRPDYEIENLREFLDIVEG
ncbi:MAG: HAD family hydrolase [Candidatus Nanohaloarchaea archaeon]